MLTSRFEEALAWAAELHREQRRKGGATPYIAHLLAVTSLVLESGADEEEAIAALLHDAVEDQGGKPVLSEIERRYGARVATIVEGCTDAYEIPKPPWRARKEAFVERLATASDSVKLVVVADKLHNASSTVLDLRAEGAAVWERFSGRRDGTLWYYRAVCEALQPGAPAALILRLVGVVAELEELGETHRPVR